MRRLGMPIQLPMLRIKRVACIWVICVQQEHDLERAWSHEKNEPQLYEQIKYFHWKFGHCFCSLLKFDASTAYISNQLIFTAQPVTSCNVSKFRKIHCLHTQGLASSITWAYIRWFKTKNARSQIVPPLCEKIWCQKTAVPENKAKTYKHSVLDLTFCHSVYNSRCFEETYRLRLESSSSIFGLLDT
jgi:hypothetical protein